MARIVTVDPIEPQAELIAEAVEVLRGGGLVVYPTRCIYGLGCDATNPAAVAKVFEVKGRSEHRPVSVICKTGAMIENIVDEVTPLAQKIMNRFWPGSATIVLKANNVLPPLLSAGTGKIGVRRMAHPVAAALAALLDRPITATSANLSGRDGCHRVEDLSPEVLAHVDLVLDAGELDSGVGSTVVDATGPEPVIIREGILAAEEIMAIAHSD
ncbi:MAG: L-threonylcarbamoyladenylate synthase [Desulfobacteraceae bacterium]|jgi:L-threonylcarbamoyladenylate synthase|nr:L-threonylcarbamoyladenylate synthase [Desulfobacteraceae bacterium]